MKFLRAFGLGLIYILLLPIFTLVVAIVAIYGVFEYFVLLFKVSLRFFQGRKGFKPLPEDIQVDAIKAEQLRRQMEATSQPSSQPTPSSVYIQTNYYPGGSQPMNQPSYPTSASPLSQQPPYPNPYSQYPYPDGTNPNATPTIDVSSIPSQLSNNAPTYDPSRLIDKGNNNLDVSIDEEKEKK